VICVLISHGSTTRDCPLLAESGQSGDKLTNGCL
jgi:hypothetical protein